MKQFAIRLGPALVDRFAREIDYGVVAGKIKRIRSLPPIDVGNLAISRATDARCGEALPRKECGQPAPDPGDRVRGWGLGLFRL